MNFQKFTTFKTILIALVLTINANQLFAQTTNGIFFQAVARDNFSNPAKDRKIFVQSSIIQTTPTGTKVLTEEHQANTDATGVFSISLGNGVRVGGTASGLATIDWSKGPFYLNLKVAITPIGGNSNWDYNKEWVDMGTTSFGAVPFALYSASSAKVSDKLDATDTTKMLAVYAKAMSVKTLETSLATKLTAADTLTMLAPYAKAAYTIDSNFFRKQLATKLSLSDSTTGYVTPLQLAAKTFDQTPITNAIATKLNIADSTKYITPTQLSKYNFSSGGGGVTVDTTSLSNRINLKANATEIISLNSSLGNKLNIADSTFKFVTPAQLASYNFSGGGGSTIDTSSLSRRINLKANANDLTNLNTSVASNTSSITANTLAIASEAATARAAELLLNNSLSAQTTAIATKLNITDTSYLLKKTDTASLSNRINLKLNANQLGVANGIASLNASGIIPSSQLPPVSLSSTSVVASDADMTALSATVGSIAIRTDLNKNYVLSSLPASTLGNWVELLTPAAPVQTVNGYTGSVNLTKTDFDLGNLDNTSDVNKPISTETQTALNLKANTSNVNTALALKMNITDANTALATKSNSTEVNTALATKISTADATAALNLKLDANKVGAVNGVASLNALGKVPTDQIPAISFSSVKVLSSEAEMLGLSSAVVGSVVIRTDLNKNYVLAQANPAVLANWIQLLTPAPPVQTVNGMMGDVTITKTSLGLDNVQNTSDADKIISSLTQSALDTKVDKVTGKVLSTNDYTTAEKTKLNGITGTNTGDQDLSAYATTTALASKAPLASPNFSGTVSTAAINAGAISATSITTPVLASTPITLSYSGSTINWNPTLGLNAAITLNQNSTLSFTVTPAIGSYGRVVLTQDVTGSRTITLPTITNVTNKVLGSTSTRTVVLSTAANAKDILNFYYDGTNCYWNIGQGYGSAATAALTLTTTGTGAATLSGTTLNIPAVSSTVNASSISGTVAVANGGTGVTTSTGTGNLVLSASPTFSGTMTTGNITSGPLSATSINTPIYASTPQVLTDGANINWNPILGLNASVTLAGNRTLSFFSTPAAGSYGTLVVTQDATGGRTLTLPSTANKVLGSTSTTTIALSTAANAKDILNFYYDGTNCYWNIGQGYGSAATAALTLTTTGTGAATLSGTTLNIPAVSSTVNASSISGTVAVANGGTGAANLTGYVKANGTNVMTASTSIPVADVTGAAPISSPIFSDIPQAPTAVVGTNTTQIATTAFVKAAIRSNSDEFTATLNQTVFTFTTATSNTGAVQTPLTKPFMYINGTRIKNSAYTWTAGNTYVTYIPANNNSYTLVAGDRVQFDYAY